MTTATRMFTLAVFATMLVAPSGYGADIDRTAVDFKSPANIKWVRNAGGPNEQAASIAPPRT